MRSGKSESVREKWRVWFSVKGSRRGGKTRDETKRMDARDARNESDRCTYGSRQAEGILTWT